MNSTPNLSLLDNVAYRVAVILPCYNEETAIGEVVRDYRKILPQAAIHVFDNMSSDATARVAREAGADVITVAQRGKGNVVRRMFADIDADIYVMADGDHTYDAASAPAMINRLVRDNLDMVVGCRVDREHDAYRPGHRFGNRLLTSTVRRVFGGEFSDMLSGFRVFSRRFVKSFPALTLGFEIETELTIHALELRMPCAEIDTPFYSRPDGSHSKLSTWRDGLRILRTIARLYTIEHPLAFYSMAAVMLTATGILLAVPIVVEFLETGLVPRLPTVILSTGLVLTGVLAFVSGLILDAVTRARQEVRRFAYLSLPGPRRG